MDTITKDIEVPVMSQFSLEAENAMLKEQLRRNRIKVSRLRRECSRLNYVYNLLLHATSAQRFWKSVVGVDVNGNAISPAE